VPNTTRVCWRPWQQQRAMATSLQQRHFGVLWPLTLSLMMSILRGFCDSRLLPGVVYRTALPRPQDPNTTVLQVCSKASTLMSIDMWPHLPRIEFHTARTSVCDHL
jgi:hypothetical protein